MLQSLGSTDLKAALDCLGAISEATAADRAFARHGVASLRRLIPSELATLSICDLDTGRRRVVSDVCGALSRSQVEAFDRHFHEHPLVCAHGRNPAATTRRISDLVPATRFRATPLYNDYYRPMGIAHAMAAPIHVHRQMLVSFVFNRSGRDFSDRERARLEAVRAHLGNLYRLSDEVEGARAAWGVPSAQASLPPDARLTVREREVLGWIAAGKTDRDIGDILGISPRTVHKHLQRIYEKLGVENRTAAAARIHL
jgi:DNA-binding CsgD family transcriptional regulator